MNKLNILPSNPEPPKEDRVVASGRFPSWLHRKLPKGAGLFQTSTILQKYGLNTVCEEAKCPNRLECYNRKTATFLALGKECTRNCGFCAIDFSKAPKTPEADEPYRIAQSVKDLGLRHVVITMVARDDLIDGGAAHLAAIVKAIQTLCYGCSVEVLTSDFNGNFSALDLVLEQKPDVFNHNIETVRSLTARVRHRAQYDRTLAILNHVKKSGQCSFVKSGLMIGLGEKEEEVKETLSDLYHAGCDIITIGQYLQPHQRKLLVKEFIPLEQFKIYEDYGKSIGIAEVYSGPFVRSSYNADEVLNRASHE